MLDNYRLSIPAVCRVIEAGSASCNTIRAKMGELETRIRQDPRLIHLAVPTLLKLLARPLPDMSSGDANDAAPGLAIAALRILGLPISNEDRQPAVLLHSHSRALLLSNEKVIFNWANLILNAVTSDPDDTHSLAMFVVIAGIVRLIQHNAALRTPVATHFVLIWYLCKGHDDEFLAATKAHFPDGDAITHTMVHLVAQSSLHAITYETPAYVTPFNRQIHDILMEQHTHIITVAIDRIPVRAWNADSWDDDVRYEDLVLEAFLLGLLMSCKDFASDTRLASSLTLHPIAFRLKIITGQLERLRITSRPLDPNMITVFQCFLLCLEAILRRESSIRMIADFASFSVFGLTRWHHWIEEPGRPDLPLEAFDRRLAGPASDRVHFLTEDVVASHLWLYEVFEVVCRDVRGENESMGHAEADPCILALVDRWYHLYVAVALKGSDATTKCHFSECSELGESKPLKRCAGCGLVWYHSRVCQKAAWRTNGDNHRMECLPRMYRRSLGQDTVLYTERDVVFARLIVEHELEVQREAVLAMLHAPLTSGDGLALCFGPHGPRFTSIILGMATNIDPHTARAWADVFAYANYMLIVSLRCGSWARDSVYCLTGWPTWMPRHKATSKVL